MKRHDETPGKILDRTLAEIRKTPIDEGRAQQAAANVLARIQLDLQKVVVHPAAAASLAEVDASSRIRNCTDFQALIPAWLSASLTPARKLLFEDHVHECVTCRKAVDNAKKGRASVTELWERTPAPQPRTHAWRGIGWVAAAAILLTAGVIGYGPVRGWIQPIPVYATAQRVDGSLYRITGQEVHAVQAGERVERNEFIRTGNDAGATLQLADGSQIEMSSRAELALESASDGVRVHLDRGSVIVSAARQKRGHLYVATGDFVASVVGTVFSVDSSDKGSRVSVIEGSVRIDQGTSRQTLLPGQQFSTSPLMAPTPIPEEISWSRNRDAHLALLSSVSAFAQHLADGIAASQLPHESRLAALVPEDTAVFLSLPNISQPLTESYELFRERLAETPALQQKWQALTSGPGKLPIDELVGSLTTASSYLGSEIVVAIPKDMRLEAPVVIASTSRPADLEAALTAGIGKLTGAGPAPIYIAHSEAELGGRMKAGAAIFIGGGLMVASPDSRQIQKTLAARGRDTSGFATTALYRRINEAYKMGAGWFIAADAHSFGVPGVEQFVLEQSKDKSGVSYRAALGFDGSRRGPAAWLGDPAPMGALGFVSANAYGAAGLITQDPETIMAEILPLLKGRADGLPEELQGTLASLFGNEFLMAIDGPLLPTPSWKAVIEVNDAARLQDTIQMTISEMNRQAADSSEPAPFTLAAETDGGRTFYSLTSRRLPFSIQYVFWDGYLIAAPNRTLLSEAIQVRQSGNSLDRSSQFRSLFPADGHDYASGFIYRNLPAVSQKMPSLPSLICLYGEPDQIVVSSRGAIGLNVAGIVGFHGMLRAMGME